MKKKLPARRTGKWLDYTGMVTAFIAVASEAQGQIISVDLDPDAHFSSPGSSLDFDGDGVTDFSFDSWSTDAGSSMNMGAQAAVPVGNGFIEDPSPCFSPKVLAYGSLISAGNPGFTTADPDPLFATLAWDGTLNCGVWWDQMGYMGVRFVGGDGANHFGWVELSVNVEFFCCQSVVMAYGYESTPGMAIAAGATSGSVGLTAAALPDLGFDIAPNPIVDQAMISLPEAPADGWNLSVIDPLGRTLINRSAVHEGTLSLDLEALAPGTYFVRLGNGKESAFRKLVKR